MKNKQRSRREFEAEFLAQMKIVFEKFSKLSPRKKQYALGFVAGAAACQEDEQLKDLFRQILDALKTIGKKSGKAVIRL